MKSDLKIIYDCNIYDKLGGSTLMVGLVKKLVRDRKLLFMATPTLWREILESPHAKLAKSLLVVFKGEGDFLAGGQVGDRFWGQVL